ncbi:terpene cyclase/mutase family protein [Peribacillus faecalis]|uniref:terpene cyclase/mutase family protein n=1 Tax=Peribacillus faecalis TaxID=2772559 RepID=UPI0038B291BA
MLAIQRQLVQKNLHDRCNRLSTRQSEEGSWQFNFEGPILTDCFMIIVLRSLNMETEMIRKLLKRLVSLQNENGSWSIYSDEKNGNLSATIQAYTAMLISDEYDRSHKSMKKAETFISANGGLKKAHFMTKMILAVNGLYAYPSYFYFPMTYFLIPPFIPLNMYNCSNYARVHMTPIIIAMNKKFSIKHDVDTSFYTQQPNESWFREDRDYWTNYFIDTMKSIALTPLHLHKAGYKSAEKLMLDRIEKNGTLYSYASASFYMIYALMALGYEKQHPIFQKAIKGILDYATDTRNGIHIQNSPSTVWDTALLSYALQEAGMSINHPTIIKANQYLLRKQQRQRGDWIVNAPEANVGGWGFSDSNHYIPDNDDTGAALRALSKQRKTHETVRNAWRKGLAYLLAMQNRDGGWGAFEKNAYHPILAYVPIENAKDALIDDSTADLTGRVLELLGNYGHYRIEEPIIKRAADWLIHQQREDGSWYGKWGICYIYGTWAAVTGLLAIGLSKEHPAIQKAIKWLQSVQQKDGGWGESCESAERERYIPLRVSTSSQTAWALDTLLTVLDPREETIQRAVHFLLNKDGSNDEATYYPTGLGLRGGFYIYYESYNEIFPLLALGHYLKKLGQIEA